MRVMLSRGVGKVKKIFELALSEIVRVLLSYEVRKVKNKGQLA